MQVAERQGVQKMEDKRRTQKRILIAAAGIALLSIGLLRGEASAVLQKAVRICLECIGIG